MQSQENNLQISSSIRTSFFEISKWAKFLSILGYISLFFMALGSIAFLLGGLGDSQLLNNTVSRSSNGFEFSSSVNPMLFGIVYTGLTILYFFPVRALYRFSHQINNSLHANFQGDFEEAISNLKTHYRFLGIMTIVGISMSILLFIMTLVFAAGFTAGR